MTTSMCLSVLYSTDSAAVSHDEKQFFARSVGLSSRRIWTIHCSFWPSCRTLISERLTSLS